jgi:hypothetical protein
VLQFLTVKNCGCKIENYVPNVILVAFAVEVMGYLSSVKWLAKLALLAVLPMKCFAFLNSHSLHFFFHLMCWHIVLP